MAKKAKPVGSIAQNLRRHMQDRGLTQADIAAGAGISQSQVSRLLAGKTRRLSRAVRAICEYADIETHVEIEHDPRGNRILINALREVWDGTDEHARLIAGVVASLAQFRR